MKRKTLASIFVGSILTVLAAGTCVALYYLVIAVVKGSAVTQDELSGTWTADYNEPPDTIILTKDFKYVHTYVIPDGSKIVDTDTWELKSPTQNPQIVFHHFALFRPDRTSYSCDDNWSVPVVPWLNKHRLVVDSDLDFYFEK